MGAYIVRKLLYGIAVLWGVATLVFFLFNILPGDPAQMMLGQRADHHHELPHARRRVRAHRPHDRRYAIDGETHLRGALRVHSRAFAGRQNDGTGCF